MPRVILPRVSSRRNSARLALVLALFCATLIAHSASATVTCGSLGGWRDGYEMQALDPSGNTYEGIYGNVVPRSSTICDTAAHDSTNYNNSYLGVDTPNGYAITGFFRWWGSATYHYTQYQQSVGSGFIRDIFTQLGSVPLGTSVLYKAAFSTTGCASTSCEVLSYNTSVLKRTPFDPFLAWPQSSGTWFTTATGSWSWTGTSVPGSSTSPVSYRGVTLQQYDQTWSTSYPHAFSDTREGSNQYACQTGFNYTAATRGFNIWEGTSPC